MSRRRQPELSIADLERMLEERRVSLQKLLRLRAELLRKLDAVDREIGSLGGEAAVDRTAGGRVRNRVSLVETMHAVMGGKPPMKVGDILEGVLAAGYHSTSDNFRGIINQTLIKDDRFVAVRRGMYTIQ